jgi:hypothetical protein
MSVPCDRPQPPDPRPPDQQNRRILREHPGRSGPDGPSCRAYTLWQIYRFYHQDRNIELSGALNRHSLARRMTLLRVARNQTAG